MALTTTLRIYPPGPQADMLRPYQPLALALPQADMLRVYLTTSRDGLNYDLRQAHTRGT